MTEDRDVNLARFEQRLETPAGKGASKLLLAAFGIVTAALLSTIAWNVHQYTQQQESVLAQIREEHDANATQSTGISLLDARVDAIERKTDAQVAALQALTVQVTRNGDAIDHNATRRGRQ